MLIGLILGQFTWNYTGKKRWVGQELPSASNDCSRRKVACVDA